MHLTGLCVFGFGIKFQSLLAKWTPPPLPESVFNRMQVNGLFRVDGQVGENHTEFSTAVDSGDRTVTQAISTSVKGSQATGGF